MDRQIFNLDLTVEAKSAYILIAATVEDNAVPTKGNLLARWTIAPEKLDGAIDELKQKSIVTERLQSGGVSAFFPNPSSLWR